MLVTYCKLPKISPRAYIRRGLSTEGNLCFKINWASLIVWSKVTILLCFTLYLRASPWGLGGLYLEGRFNGGLFALPVWVAYIWRGLYMDWLIFGIFAVFKLCNTTWCIYRCIIGRQEFTLSINLQCQVCVFLLLRALLVFV